MKTGEAFRVALGALQANRLRSLLTMLGVISGVGAVVVLVAIGSGAKQTVESQVEGLGSNLIVVLPGRIDLSNPGAAPSVSRLRTSDIDVLARVVGNPALVTTTIASGESVRVGGNEVYANVNGTTETLPTVFDRPLAEGAYFRAADVETRRRVAVLGSQAASQLFGEVDPLGRQVSIAGVRFRVVGVFAETGAAFGVSRDTEVHIPVTTAQRLFGTDRLDGFAVKAPSADDVEPLQGRLVSALERRYPGEEFSAVTQTQILGVIGSILNLLTLVLGAIAGISLLVGGVGVSNIMLVSVRERTREIGLRKALGARHRDITLQFLLEAVMLCVIGGLIGIGGGVAIAVAADRLTPLPAVISWWSPVLAFGVSVAVGVFFGVVPARRAGRLDPVVALRTE